MHRFLLLLHHKFKLEKYGENPPLFNLKIKNKLPHSKRLITAKEIPQLKKKRGKGVWNSENSSINILFRVENLIDPVSRISETKN